MHYFQLLYARKRELKLFLNIARKGKEKGYIEQNIKN